VAYHIGTLNGHDVTPSGYCVPSFAVRGRH
jgi:hypothetical protein